MSFFPPPVPPGPSGPQGPQGTQGGPTSPPPSFTPQQPAASLYAVDPGTIAGCMFRNTYIWLANGESFWYYPTYVGRTSTSGFRWNGRFWMYDGVDLRRIRTFACY